MFLKINMVHVLASVFSPVLVCQLTPDRVSKLFRVPERLRVSCNAAGILESELLELKTGYQSDSVALSCSGG